VVTPTVTVTPDEPGATTTGPAEPEARTLSSAGGTVRAVCPAADTAKLVSWSATRPFRVEDVSAGPAAEAVAVFRRGSRLVRMTVTCAAGVPSSSNTEL
jgi:serine/threonine-protein kinase